MRYVAQNIVYREIKLEELSRFDCKPSHFNLALYLQTAMGRNLSSTATTQIKLNAKSEKQFITKRQGKYGTEWKRLQRSLSLAVNDLVKRPLPNKSLLSNKRPPALLNYIRYFSLIDAPCLTDAHFENYFKILGIRKRSKIIHFIQFLAWLTRLCVFHLVQCHVQVRIY